MFLRDSHQNQMQQFYSNHGDHHPANAEVSFHVHTNNGLQAQKEMAYCI
jgi:hypothetical protein